MITWIKDLVESVKSSNYKHSEEHKNIINLLKVKSDEDTNIHTKLLNMADKTNDNIERLHKLINK